MQKQRRDVMKMMAGLCGSLALPTWARAANQYPTAPVTVIVPFASGNSTDILARLLITKYAQANGGNFIVEDKPGAAGNIGAHEVAIARADGNTLMYSTATPFAINPFVYKHLPYDPDHDFVAISRTAALPLVIGVTSKIGVDNIHDFIDYLRKNQATCSFSSYGVGTSSHIAGEIFVKLIGAPKVLHVPYKDMTAMSDLAAGRNTFHIDAWSNIDALAKTGKVKALAVTSTQPLPWAPQLPTVASVTHSDYQIVTWHAFFAPRGTPDWIVQKLNHGLQAVIDQPEVQKTYTEQGFLVYPPATPAEVTAFVRNDKKRWEGYVKMAGVQPS